MLFASNVLIIVVSGLLSLAIVGAIVVTALERHREDRRRAEQAAHMAQRLKQLSEDSP